MRHFLLLSFLAFLLSPNINLAQAPITVEDIYGTGKFRHKTVPGFNFQNDGRHYTRLEDNSINQYDLTTGENTATIFSPAEIKRKTTFSGNIDGYQFSADESRILLWTDRESIYRRSFRANYFVWDRNSKSLFPVFQEAKIQYATFNPAADKIAYVFDNNLYCRDFKSGETSQITEDGKFNHIINGSTDWVYEEEFAFAKAFQWSADGKKIAFYRFDESQVKEFTMTKYQGGMYPDYETFKYPKVGEDNAKVSIHVYNTDSYKTAKVIMDKPMEYVPRIKWTKNSNQLCVFNMNRHQNELELLLANATSGKTTVLLKEKNQWYIDIHDDLTFLEDGEHFLWLSEKDGFNHVYLYDMKGKLVNQITKGDWEVTAFHGVDEANKTVYYQAAKTSPMQREIYTSSLDGSKTKMLTKGEGWHRAQFSSTFDYYVDNYSTMEKAPVYTVFSKKGKKVRVIEDNADMEYIQKEHDVQPVEFINFTTSEGVALNGYTIKPPNFDENKKYPVFMYLYGGPGSQQVVDSWQGGRYYWWLQMLAQKGYIVACVDNRGTGGRGEEFKKMTYKELGKYETIDQIEAAKYLGGLSYTDPNRIGIFGWSYGGYMSSLCLLKGNDVFKAAIAVAPVTSWKWYDSIYTERYMQTVEENPDGYFNNSPVNFVNQLKGNYLLLHGGGDDNVHFQHTAEMANALINANKQFDTYYYPNRNHGIYGGATRMHLFTKMTNFLEEKLKGDARPVGEVKP